MPELPEIITLSGQMAQALSGQEIHEIYVYDEKCLNTSPGKFYEQALGKRIRGVSAKGNRIYMELEGDLWVLLSLEAGGEILLNQNLQDLPERYHWRLDFTSGTALTVLFWDSGRIDLWTTEELNRHGLNGTMPPAPLNDPRFNQEFFFSALEGRSGTVKEFLLDQDNLTGIGNIYVQDILFKAGIHPCKNLDSLNNAEKVKLYNSIVEILAVSLEQHGLAYQRDLYGTPGGFKNFLINYREGEPCPSCETSIKKIRTGQTTSYICPNCQPIKAM